MIFQALTPSFWGSLADIWGRRPVYISTEILYVGICAGLANAPSFPALLVLRMFQAAGASSAIALGTLINNNHNKGGVGKGNKVIRETSSLILLCVICRCRCVG